MKNVCLGTRKAEVMNSLIMNITAKANDTNDILQTFRKLLLSSSVHSNKTAVILLQVLIGHSGEKRSKKMKNTKAVSVVTSGESRIIFLPERSSICQYPPKISVINIKKQSKARLLLAHPVLNILKIQKTYGTFWKALGYRLRTAICTVSESGSGNATWVTWVV